MQQVCSALQIFNHCHFASIGWGVELCDESEDLSKTGTKWLVVVGGAFELMADFRNS